MSKSDNGASKIARGGNKVTSAEAYDAVHGKAKGDTFINTGRSVAEDPFRTQEPQLPKSFKSSGKFGNV